MGLFTKFNIIRKHVAILALIAGYFVTANASGQTLPTLDLTGYQDKSGAITVGYEDNFVDPYFAMRSLLTASEEGLDTTKVALPWIKWLIKMQRPDGRFDRYCKEGDKFVVCQDADADDVNMALWAELLTEFADNSAMPRDWHQSYEKALNYLQNNLYDPQQGIYHISTAEPVGLFMDNVEIAHAFFRMVDSKRQQGDVTGANMMELQANKLSQAIENIFGTDTYYEVSTQPDQTHGLYPGATAQIYPWIFSIPSKFANDKINFNIWYSNWHVDAELQQSDDAWGLIAIAAKKADNVVFVQEWLDSAELLRPYDKWNILDEIVYQVLKGNTPKNNNII